MNQNELIWSKMNQNELKYFCSVNLAKKPSYSVTDPEEICIINVLLIIEIIELIYVHSHPKINQKYKRYLWNSNIFL